MIETLVLSGRIWSDLGLTAVHVVWQGGLIVLLTAVVLYGLRRRSASSRYVVCAGAMACVILASLVTFMHLSRQDASASWWLVSCDPTANRLGEVGPADAGVVDPNVPAATREADAFPPLPNTADADELIVGATANGNEADHSGSILAGTDNHTVSHAARDAAVYVWRRIGQVVATFLDGKAGTVLALAGCVWVVGASLLSLRLAMGWLGLRRLRRAESRAVDERLRVVIDRLRVRLGIGPNVRVSVTPAVEQPLAFGLLKPVVLVPVSMLTACSPDVIEAMIAHELAHIRRHDLWVNVLQRLVEAIVFFHPGVWWLSGRMRLERELCCDDLAVAATGRRLEYAEALYHLSADRVAQALSMMAAGVGATRPTLLRRVRRVLELPEPRQQGRFWLAGPVGLVLAIGIFVAATQFRLAEAGTNEHDQLDSPNAVESSSAGAPLAAGHGDLASAAAKKPGAAQGVKSKENPDGLPEEFLELDKVDPATLAARLCRVVMGKDAVLSQGWIDECVKLRKSGGHGITVVRDFVSSERVFEYTRRERVANVLRVPGDKAFVTQLHEHLLNRPPSQGESDVWLGKLRKGMTRLALLRMMLRSDEFVLHTVHQILGRPAEAGPIPLIQLPLDESFDHELGVWRNIGGGSFDVSDGKLTFSTETGDVGEVAPPKHLFLAHPPMGVKQWTMVARLSFEPTTAYQQAGLVAYVDNYTCLKFVVYYGGYSGGNGVITAMYTYRSGQRLHGGTLGSAEGEYYWLRLVRDEDYYLGYIGSGDGPSPARVRWVLVHIFEFDLRNPCVGFGGWSALTSTSSRAVFDRAMVTKGLPADLSRHKQRLTTACSKLSKLSADELANRLSQAVLGTRAGPALIKEIAEATDAENGVYRAIRSFMRSDHVVQRAWSVLPDLRSTDSSKDFARGVCMTLFQREPEADELAYAHRAVLPTSRARHKPIRNLAGTYRALADVAELAVRGVVADATPQPKQVTQVDKERERATTQRARPPKDKHIYFRDTKHGISLPADEARERLREAAKANPGQRALIRNPKTGLYTGVYGLKCAKCNTYFPLPEKMSIVPTSWRDECPNCGYSAQRERSIQAVLRQKEDGTYDPDKIPAFIRKAVEEYEANRKPRPTMPSELPARPEKASGQGTKPTSTQPRRGAEGASPPSTSRPHVHPPQARGFGSRRPAPQTTRPTVYRLVRSPADGIVAEVLVKTGDKVKEGQVVARLDDAELKLELEEAKLKERIAELNYSVLQQLDPVHRPKWDYNTKQAQKDLAKLEVKRCELRLERAQIKSPCRGTIENIVLHLIGKHVEAGEELMRIRVDSGAEKRPMPKPTRSLGGRSSR